MQMEKQYEKLAHFGKELLDKTSLEEGLPLISDYAKEVIGAERCSIFIYNTENNTLWTTLADEVDKITISAYQGVAGYTIKEKKTLVVNDVKEYPLFLADIDEETGYVTKNIITAPVFNSQREIIGVLELLNKEGDFTAKDEGFMVFFSHYISGYIELATLYQAKG